MEAVPEENGLKEFVENDIPKPRTTDVKYLTEWKKRVAK